MKGNSSEEEEIGIRKYRRISRVEIMNEEAKGWTPSPKQQQDPTRPTNTKKEIFLELMKRELKRAAL